MKKSIQIAPPASFWEALGGAQTELAKAKWGHAYIGTLFVLG